MMRILSALALLLLAARPASSQELAPTPTTPGGEELVDRVVAVVGDTALLLSDLRAAVQQIQASGATIPEDPAQRDAFLQQVLEDRVNSLLMVEAARDAGITVDETQVSRAVDDEIVRVARGFGGSEARLETALQADGMSMTQYRELLRQQFADDQLTRSFMAERMRARARPVISESEVREAFEAQRARLGTRPPTVSFRQVLISPEPSDSADAQARRTAEEVYTELQNGGDWQVLARRFSDDPGSKESGGELGWVRQGEGLVPEFERMAFSMRPGVLSPIFRTDFGYHVLEVQRTQGAERRVRHILIQPEVTEDDVERARVRADSVANAVREGANITVLARQYGTPDDQIEIPPQPLSGLPPAYAEPLGEAQSGDVVGPFKVTGTGADNWAVVRVTLREEERPYTLEDVREQLMLQLQEGKMIAQIVEDLRNNIYVAVRM